MKKFKVTFDKDEIAINGKITSSHYDGNAGRSVYVCEKYVIKINNRGYSHSDLDVWNSIRPEHRQYFVPTLAEGFTPDGYTYSIQPFVDLEEYDITEEARELVGELVSEYGLSDIDYYEGTPRNWAMHNGQPIIFDYGL